MLAGSDSGLVPFSVLLPLAGGLVAFVLPRAAAAIGVGTALANLAVSAALALQVGLHGSATHPVGGWGAPLGIDLRADGPAVALLLITGLVAAAISLHATRSLRGANASAYWPLWLFLVTALNALFLSSDLFNLYVTLELLGLSAVALTALEGGREPLESALRYLLASLAGSLAYLLGVALVYHAHGSLDIETAGAVAGPAASTALVLMTIGLLLKAALFPFHFWLPAAHGSAAAPVSAALSALVLKGAFFVLLRLWLEVFPAQAASLYGPLCGLGAAAVIWGSLQAIVQARMKLLIAYSTVAQMGYLFLALPLVTRDPEIWGAILLLAASHALAKSALFLAAGNLVSLGRGDRLDDLGAAQQSLPLTSGTLGIAGVCIMGLPPTGGFSAKWLLLASAIGQQRWDIAGVLVLGGLLSAVYVFRLVDRAFLGPDRRAEIVPLPAARELPALGLALLAVALGFATLPWLELVSAGGALAAAGTGP